MRYIPDRRIEVVDGIVYLVSRRPESLGRAIVVEGRRVLPLVYLARSSTPGRDYWYTVQELRPGEL